MSRYNSLFFLIIAGLCFGQRGDSEVDTRTSLMLSRSMYTKHGFALRSSPALGCFYDDDLMVPVEGESLQLKTSFWKQSGIYGLEFFGSAVGTALSLTAGMFLGYEGGDYYDYTRGLVIYGITNVLLTSTCSYVTGHILKQKGRWRRSAFGAGLGCLIGVPMTIILAHQYPEGFMNGVAFGVLVGTPPLGAVIGYNIR